MPLNSLSLGNTQPASTASRQSKMLISNIINDSFGLLSKQLRFYCWHFRRNLDQKQRQELIELLSEHHFERLATKIKSLTQSCQVADCKQQIARLLFEHCFNRNRRHQIIELIRSGLVDIDVRLDNYGRTLLHRAAYTLDVELVKILIDNGVNIRLRDYAGNTALHIAIQSYRNGAVIYGNGPDVVQNLTSIIRLLLKADRDLQLERVKRKKVKLLTIQAQAHDNVSASSRLLHVNKHAAITAANHSIIKMNDELACGENRHPFKIVKTESRHVNQSIDNSVSSCKQVDKQNDCTATKNHHELSTKTGDEQSNCSARALNSILLEDISSPLIDTKNAFGRTALHYCVLVVGEQHLAHFVQLLISFEADTDAVDTRMKTPLYCLVKRPNIAEFRQKCMAITYLLESGCDDLGLAIEPRGFFTENFFKNLEQNLTTVLQSEKPDGQEEPIFNRTGFQRVPTLKHLVRLKLVKLQGEKTKLKRQTRISLPALAPNSLNLYLNRKILDQSELFGTI